MTIRIGTRKSRLALAQTAMFAAALEKAYPGVEIQTVEIVTHGDRVLDRPLGSIGGKGVFVEEIEQALRCGEIDVAVHSAKDLPVQLGEGLEISGVLPRGDSRDMLISRQGAQPGVSGFVVGTGSMRRRSNFSKLYPGAKFADIRGNVDTRLRKLSAGEYDGIILCAAGIKRLGLSLEGFSAREFSCREFVPAPCQGIIAAECAAGSRVSEMLRSVSDKETALCFAAEREIIRLLGADCTVPVGAYSEINRGVMDIIITDRNGNTVSGSCAAEKYSEKIKELISSL